MDLTTALRFHRLVAVVRGDDPQGTLDTVTTLVEEGVGLVEVSLTGRDALDVLAQARRALGPDAPLGAGTVLTADDAHSVRRAGVDFVVTPALCEGATVANSLGLAVLAGAMTPSEIVSAMRQGADAVKVFPAAQTGGPAYLRVLRGPFPDVPLVPMGGVDTAGAREYLADGATAVGVGSPLVGDAADGGSLDALRERARAFLTAVSLKEDV